MCRLSKNCTDNFDGIGTVMKKICIQTFVKYVLIGTVLYSEVYNKHPKLKIKTAISIIKL